MAKVEVTSASSKLKQLGQGLKSEWNRIVWPSKNELGRQLAAVLIVSVITGLLIVLADFGSEKLINFLVNL